ncbi:MAG: protease inhibitor I42 family protein [Solirubrobacteraceae bacterium]
MRFLGPVIAAAVLAGAAVPASADQVVTKSGRTVSLAPYERVTVRLVECASCGYRWQIAKAPKKAMMKKLSNRYVAPQPDGTVGGPGKRVLVYRAVTPGATDLRLRYVAPDGSVAKRFTLHILVTAR